MKRLSPYLFALVIITALVLFFQDSIMTFINYPATVTADSVARPAAAGQISDTPAASSPGHSSDVTPAQPIPAPEKYTGTAIPILMYHEVTSGPNSLYVPVGKFREQMRYLAVSGYRAVTMTQAEEMLRNKKMPAKTIVLTFDDGYTSFITEAWPIMQEYGFTGTVYACTSFIGRPNYLTMEQIKTLQADGVEIGSHTRNHIDLKTASYKQQVDEIVVSKQILEENLGVPCLSFCYPTGTYSDITPTIVKDAGYTSAVTVAYGHAVPASNPYLTPRVRVPGWITLDKFAQSIPK
ncbi:MAG: polysaccharide deacetylase family protein [Syntrophomonadaceae bacterium]